MVKSTNLHPCAYISVQSLIVEWKIDCKKNYFHCHWHFLEKKEYFLISFRVRNLFHKKICFTFFFTMQLKKKDKVRDLACFSKQTGGHTDENTAQNPPSRNSRDRSCVFTYSSAKRKRCNCTASQLEVSVSPGIIHTKGL